MESQPPFGLIFSLSIHSLAKEPRRAMEKDESEDGAWEARRAPPRTLPLAVSQGDFSLPSKKELRSLPSQ
jgi:hypothetical protein